jgi:acyl-CoA synthetase (AMP-forming)/AMP-acid ligase II
VGELVARGGNVTAGYLGAPEETAATFREDGLHTGDLAYRDGDGFFYVVGRSKEMLKLGGHRVSPVEIERVLLEHPAVLEAAVAGMPDPVLGEAPCAFVVCRHDEPVSDRALRAFTRGRLPSHCVPAAVRFVTALPRGGAGKLQRQVLAKMAREGSWRAQGQADEPGPERAGGAGGREPSAGEVSGPPSSDT